MKYTQNYNLRKPEDTDPADIQDLNYNADAIDGKLKEIEDWEAAHLQASNPHGVTAEQVGTYDKTAIDLKDASTLQAAKDFTYSRVEIDNKDAVVLQEAKDYTDVLGADVLELQGKVEVVEDRIEAIEDDISSNYYDKTEIDTMIGDIETLLEGI